MGKVKKTVGTSQEKKSNITGGEDIREVIIERESGFNTIEVIVIILISTLFGVVVGCFLSSSRSFGVNVSDGLSEVISTYDTILDNYYEEIDENVLADAAISGMLGVLDDPYSIYMNSSDTDSFLENVNGSFVGIGISVELNDGFVRVVDVINDSPAKRAGVKINDRVIEVDDESVEGVSISEFTKLIKGNLNSKVKLTVLRDGKKIDFLLKRSVIEILSVQYDVYENNIGYIFIESFSSVSYKQFNKAFQNLKSQNIKSLIIDVRNNPGGKLGQVNKILDLFFDKKTVLYKIVSKDETTAIYAEDQKKENMPIVVLVNHDSASASEILAACFKDNYLNSTIIGNVTYGKGTIQKAIELSSGSSFKYTTQKWVTSKGEWLNGNGVVPNEVINQSSAFLLNPSFENDLQLKKAIEILNK